MNLENRWSQNSLWVGLSILLISLGVGMSQAAEMDCTTTVDITANFTMNESYATTSASDCFKITGTNVVFNCSGKEIRCKNTSGTCGNAIRVVGSGATVKNCYILGLTDDWTVGVNDLSVFGVFRDTDVTRTVVDNAAFAMRVGGSVTDSVFTGITNQCISPGFSRQPAGLLIKDNFCQSDNDGIVVKGQTSGANVDVEQNYVQATNSGILQLDGLVNIERNIVDATTPMDLLDDTEVTLTDNICTDNTDCPVPDDFPFGTALTINFR